MGRSNSCFKIITCAGDSAADKEDDLQIPPVAENKGSSDKRGWSFRKKSASHRVLSNTVIAESPSSANKESPQTASLNFQPPDTSNIPEKITAVQCTNDKPRLSASAESKAPETVTVAKDEREDEDRLEESDVIVIQSAVRVLLVQRELLKLKNVIKLQAAVRGHLVRQHAVGTLRCVQAIVKMQALVRARRARLLLEGSCEDNNLDGMHDQKKEKSANKPNDTTYTSIEKLLSNSFARQLMGSTPKTKPIHIKCDPMKPNSAWNWFERWMTISSAKPSPTPDSLTEEMETQKSDNSVATLETQVPPEGIHELGDPESDTEKPAQPSESEENLKSYDTDIFEFHAQTSSFGEDNLEHSEPENTSTADAKDNSIDPSPSSQIMQSDVNSQVPLISLPHKPERESEQADQPKRSMKRFASEELETEGKKFVRKVSNSAFIAAQSKFEMGTTPNASRSFSPTYQDNGVESAVDAVTRTKEFNVSESLGPHNSRVQYVGSECGTELSITSTLDSPDISEVGPVEYEHEAKVPEEGAHNAEGKKDFDVDDAKDASMVPVPNLSKPVMDHHEKIDDEKGESMNSIVAAESLQAELKPESTPDVHREVDSEVGVPAYRSSPEASPRSHITVPESYGTPSSQVSVSAKKNRTEKSGSSQKRKSAPAGKRSPSNITHDSGARSSMEQLNKEQKNGKRRNSFGSTRPENTDQEPRDSSSNSSVPHFMQATESARAKLLANSSPRSSPDVHDRDYIKKRHSLPGANGRQGSPRIQRPIPQAQQGPKGNGSLVVHEKKWQR